MVPHQQATVSDERVMTIVKAALQAPAADRANLLRTSCQENAELLKEVNEVLAWEEVMGGFLREPLKTQLAIGDFEAPFQPGDVLSARFEIIREIGYGGMGVVYEAFDRRRECRIAIKCAKPGFRSLLSPELEGALKVRHPNICLVNEIHSTATAQGEVDFLTMELLEGETLSACLDADQGLSPAEALQIARQLCAGLAEAHRSEIIHRDLKTSNIILVRIPGQTLRAVITDFGLAGESGLEREQYGTPHYMAPELLKGERTSKASDVYALGVTLRELAIGRANSDHRWDKVVRQCLAPLPSARPTANELLQVFNGRPLWKSPILALSLIATVALLLAAYSPVREWMKPPEIRLAFLPVDAPAELAGTGAGVLHDVVNRINRSQRTQTTVIAIPVSETNANNVRTPQQAQTVLHATHAIRVTLAHQGPGVAADLSVVDLSTQTDVRRFSAFYSPSTVGSMPGALTGAICLALRLRPVTADRLSGPATIAYDRGLFFLRRDDDSYSEAIPFFQSAVRLDPGSPLPLAALAEAHLREFETTRQHAALVEADQVIHAAESLNPDSVTVRLVAGLVQRTQGHYERALEDYRRVQQLEPRNIEALLRTASVYVALGDPDKATECYRKAIALEPDYYGAYQSAGRFYYYRGDFLKAAEEFKKAIERAPGLYVAYNELGAALDYLGRDSEAEHALRASLKIKETTGALNSMGAIQAYQGHDAEAATYYQRAIRINPLNYVCLLNLGDSYWRLGRQADARSAYEKALALVLAELREDPRQGLPRSYVAYLSARLGDKQRAEEEILQAKQLLPDDNMVVRKAVLTYEALGEHEHAIEALQGATADVFRELSRHPDLAGFRRNLQFKQLATRIGSTRK